MRLVFAGTPAAAVPTLRALLRSDHEVVAVLTRPDAPQGRSRRPVPSPVRVVAQEADVPVLTPASTRDPALVATLQDCRPDVCPVVAYGGLIPAPLLRVPTHGWVNLHFSLLPAWRGAAPVQHALMAGDEATGATTFLLQEGLDTGPVLGTLTEPIRPTDTAGDLLERLSTAGAELLVATLDAMEQGSAQPVPQPAQGVSHAPKLSTADARIDWTRPGYAVDRHIRGCTPAPGAWTTFRGNRLKVLPVSPEPAPGTAPGDSAGQRAASGRIRMVERSVVVATGQGDVRLGQVQPLGKPVMDAVAWARGARLEPEESLGGELSG
ncbi:MAG: methionyl-tRNA formyltransferase [Ornithinimicrobium sp.]|uniref:methionyl-tRNA formyltransferase n=1 Tax=Ornithinimicrobium sp. TaxID=1977084 RepID=UPI003D9B3E48